uniref:Secreted protein n=1 Tax=Arundo donax TaxID=35708 RepID=A0A0A9FYM6_ARUDO
MAIVVSRSVVLCLGLVWRGFSRPRLCSMNSAGAGEAKYSGSTGFSLSQFIFSSICVSASRYSAK